MSEANKGVLAVLIAIIITCVLAGRAEAGNLWLEVNGLSYHTESDYHDGYERRYGELKDLVGQPGCCYANEDYTKLYVLEEKRESYNGLNYGLGAMYELDEYIGVKGGFYNNSYKKTSLYAGLNVRYEIPAGPVKVVPNVTGGFVTGYDDTPEDAYKYQPIVLPSVAVGTDKVRLNVSYLPGQNADVYTAQLQFRIK